MQTYKPGAGECIQNTAEKIVAMANACDGEVVALFNDLTVRANPGDNPVDLVSSYMEESNRRHEAWIASPEYKKQQEDWREKDRLKKLALDVVLAFAPERLSLRDPDLWAKGLKNNQDPYGAAIYRYADTWARVMEARVVNGDTIESCADEASTLADTEGITGFMYGCAVQTLSACWIHGEELRRWHNLQWGKGGQGEKVNEKPGVVINPAVLVVATGEEE